MIKAVLIEDEDLVRREIALTTPWNALGYALIGEASNGRDGLDLILKTRPHLIITDIRMPGLDGLAMLEEVEKLMGRDKPRTLLLTGHSDFEYARKGIRLGVTAYLLKPVDDEEFHRILKKTAEELESLYRNGISGEEELSGFSEYEAPDGGDNRDFYAREAVQYISENYIRDISMGDVSEELGITLGYLSRIFREKTGYTFLEYLTLFRLRRALALLCDRTLKISEAAYRAGFQDSGYFTQVFKKHLGTTPGQYRKNGFSLKGGAPGDADAPEIGQKGTGIPEEQ